ncbi:cation:proton antiporter domain-containing protein [Periweissella beninensis]|uniref:cation:proton antiporter domain-containing protein n=1 Tax=Periweissella beninensis TaxID=504936 RepID=UPI0021A68B20|nr:cation:proton antiporter [Periweissella beninensis]
MSLAIILVALTVLTLGTLVHAVYGLLPLSLAFALIAIVPPTDAAAVSSVSGDTARFKIPQIILKNESLFNDASGIVFFELALTTYVSGYFPMQQSLFDFAKEFIGGLLFGVLLGIVIAKLRQKLTQLGDDNVTVMLILELLTPFLIYYWADELSFSGILAVVATGLIQSIEPKRLQFSASER